jgi:hypothetical protein
MANYKVNDKFKEYMSLNFYRDLTQLPYTTDNKLYLLKLNVNVNVNSPGQYLKINTSTFSIITTSNRAEAAKFIIYTSTEGQETLTKCVILAKENNLENNLSNTYIMGFDYVNCGSYNNINDVPYLRLYSASNSKLTSYEPIEFNADEISNFKNNDKLHNYKLPWFEFRFRTSTDTCLRGSGLIKNYLVYSPANTTMSIILSVDKSNSTSYLNISSIDSELALLEPVFTKTKINNIFQIPSIEVYLQPDTSYTYYRIYDYNTNNPIDITDINNYTIVTGTSIPYYKLSGNPSITDYIQLTEKYYSRYDIISLTNNSSTLGDIYLSKFNPIIFDYKLDTNKYNIKINDLGPKGPDWNPSKGKDNPDYTKFQYVTLDLSAQKCNFTFNWFSSFLTLSSLLR